MKLDKYDMLLTIIKAVDLVNPILKRHHSRTAVIAYYLAIEYGVETRKLTELTVAALLHDIGALTVADAEALAHIDVEDPEPHAKLGASMLSGFGPFKPISNIIYNHHVIYDKVDDTDITIPKEAFILHLADRIEILTDHNIMAINQKDYIWETIEAMSGSSFAPWAVACFNKIRDKEEFWYDLDYLTSGALFKKLDRQEIELIMDAGAIDDLLYTFSRIVDYKCPFTASHSAGVAQVSYLLAKGYGLDERQCQKIKMAGFLHDIGKIGVPSELIYKNGKLTDEEFNIVKAHPYYTREILKHIKGLEEIVFWASSHHERKNKKGYPTKPAAEKIGVEIEILSYADVFTALCEKRPYRDQLPLTQVLRIIETRFTEDLGERVFRVLLSHADDIYGALIDVQKKSNTEYKCAVL